MKFKAIFFEFKKTGLAKKNMKSISLLCGFLAVFLWNCSGGEEDRAWNEALQAGRIEAIDSFLLRYPNSSYRRQALSRKEAKAWALAELEQTEYYYRKYLADFPEGEHIDKVEERIAAIESPNLDLESLSSASFVGKVDYGQKQIQILSMKFRRIEDQAELGIDFIATLNTKDNRSDLAGQILRAKTQIRFDEQGKDSQIGLGQGRLYRRKDKWLIESTDAKLYWVLRES